MVNKSKGEDRQGHRGLSESVVKRGKSKENGSYEYRDRSQLRVAGEPGRRSRATSRF